MQNQTSFQVYNASAGSGKTFTLVKEYLKILLLSNNPYSYQSILAITFTNRAAGEMKERVLKSLLDFSQAKKSSGMFYLMMEETGLDEEEIQHKGKKILQNILQNYSSFHIKTIDSFTNKLIKSFAFDLGLPLDFEVELDPQAILEEAVDVIISKIGIDKELTKVLVTYAKQKTIEDKSWDVSRELNDISKFLLRENDAEEIQKLERKNIIDFKLLEKKLHQKQKEIEAKFHRVGEKGLEIIEGLQIEDKDFYYKDLPNFFRKLKRLKEIKPGDLKFEGRLNNAIQEGVLYGPKKPQNIKSIIDGVRDELIKLYFTSEDLFKEFYGKYQLNNLILKSLIPLAIINSIAKALEDIKVESNIRLISEFNQIISKHIRKQPAAFIYEKIGEKYKHYFIDEMQDTSVMQWENLIPLIDNTLSQANSSLLLVGDAKQAIYRWRGGEAEQFIALSTEGELIKNNPFHIEKQSKNLDTNYRSYSQIIEFNNQFFTHVSKYFQNSAYEDLYQIGNHQQTTNKKGGYVQLNFVEECKNVAERDEIFPSKVFETIQSLETSFDKNEICVLVRKKSQGIAIANYLSSKGIQIVSSETLLIKSSNKVDFIIQLLRFLKEEKDGNAKLNILYFLYNHLNIRKGKNEFISELVHLNSIDFYKALENHQIYFSVQSFNQSPFYESIEEIIRCFNLTKESDAYLQFFLDFVFDFTQKKSQSKTDFLDYWNLKKEKLSIVASNNKDAVQIMTIHKSKGLEFPVVIYPYDLDVYAQINPKVWYDKLDAESYNNFDSILVSSSSAVENTGDYGRYIFKKQQSELELDNFNLLYVALTRAKEQLYIISENRKAKDKLKMYSHFFIDFLKKQELWEEGKLVYEFGTNPRFSIKEETNQNIEIQEEFISTSWKDHQFNIVASSSLLWDSEREDAIKFGNLIHELMASIMTEKDIQSKVNTFINNGIIEKRQRDEIEKIVFNIVNHQELKIYFQSNKNVFTEREIITDDKQILIPDRLIIDQENNVTILDYKTGNAEKKHHDQIKNYATVLQNMGYKISQKILVYIGPKIRVVKV